MNVCGNGGGGGNDGNGSSSGGSGSSGGSAGDGEDQDDSSSSSFKENRDLENFRKEWQRELGGSTQLTSKIRDMCNHDDRIPHNVEDKAKMLFQMGVENEEKGKLYEAIQYYRRAFQLVPDIEFRLSQQVYTRPVNPDNSDKVDIDDDDEEEVGNIVTRGGRVVGNNGDVEDDEEIPFDPTKTDLLTHLQFVMQRNCERTICTPQNSTNSTHISALPMEIFLYIMRWVVSTDLDFRSLEMCSQVSRGFYICCRDPEIWRVACNRVWGLKCGTLSSFEYSSWREMFIKRPRLQFSGCYISKTTYIRPGENSFQDQFYRPWHLVQYYRYLRFFPDGRVLMLTSVEEPVLSVGLLRWRSGGGGGGGGAGSNKLPPLCHGYFRLHNNMVSIVISPSGPDLHHNHQQHLTSGTGASATVASLAQSNAAQQDNKRSSRHNTNASHNHTFHLELEISNHRNRLHGKLLWHGYSVFTNHNGIVTNTTFDLDAGRYPPFWFSRVKSYTAETSNPLV